MRRNRLIPIALGVLSLTALGLASAVEFAPRLVWNASASAPIGLYRIEMRAPVIGDFVLVNPDEVLGKFVTERGYLPKDIPLVKRVAALPGDQICRESETVFINKMRVADALLIDSRGRQMPTWSGCFSLREGEFFLLNAPEKSLDGRYFGATKLDDVVGVAIPVFLTE